MKTEETKRLERAIWKATNKQGVFGCFEVTIGWFGKERVDYMTYDTKGVFRCYEIKVTKTDFHSHCHNSFVGDLNYYVLPADLYEEVKEEIPDFVGAYIERDGIVYSIRRARRRMVEDPDTLKNSMIPLPRSYKANQERRHTLHRSNKPGDFAVKAGMRQFKA